MKPIIVNGEELYYNVEWEDDHFERTAFYKKERVKYRKWLLWGEETERDGFKLVFSISINVESTIHSKERIREEINLQIDHINRRMEIERGEII